MTKGMGNTQSDILEEILTNTEEVDDPRLEELLRFIENMGNSSPKQPTASPPRRNAERKKQNQRKGSSSYLTQKNFQTLEQVKAECRKLLAKEKKTKISKSRITEIALEIILKDFEANKEESILAQELRKNNLNRKTN